ncbi:MAG TPA: geranyl transferase, partial [Psychromonas hadalis]|nr:geranyl transferase [Psychromonas hadalis]
MTQLQNAINQYQTRANHHLTQAILHSQGKSSTLSATLNQAMAHGALQGGKRIRPFLVYAVGQMLGSPIESLDPLATAVESIHAYSLIHDDLPAIDNDDLRRGQPTCHIAFDEATAIIAGDALQALAFEVLAQPIKGISPQTQLKMISLLAKASGDKGMCAGQALDLAAENKKISLVELENIHQAKTGALIKVAVELAALSKPDLTQKEHELLIHFASAI